MTCSYSRFILFVLVTGFLVGTAPLNCEAIMVDQTNYEQFAFDITEPLVFSTLTGNRTQDYVTCIDYDEAGNLYLAGITSDTGDYDDNCDSFIMKINGTDFSPISYITIKGSNYDWVHDMCVKSGRVYLVGNTGSDDFPVENAYCDTFQNSTDCFVMCFDANSMEVIFSTYLGGEHVDTGEAIFVDNEGSIFVTGKTNSNNFPVHNSYGNFTGDSPFPPSDVYVVKINSSGNSLVYSSIIGGDAGGEVGLALVGDTLGNAYVAGVTTSEDFPTVNAFNATSNGIGLGYLNDGFVFCLNSTGNGLIFSTFIGGENSETFYDIVLDSNNDVWVCGLTESSDFPTVDNSLEFQGDMDGILFELCSNGSVLLYSSFIGGSDRDVCNSVGIDERDNVYVCGYSCSENFPLIQGASNLYITNKFFASDGFLLKISPEKSIQYSTRIGGRGSDSCKSIAVGRNGSVFVGGIAGSDDFPLRREISGPSSDIMSRGDGFALVLLDISDEDGDSFPNWWEMVNGYDPLNPNAPVIEILQWYAPVILIGVSATLLVIILILGRHRIKSWIGRIKPSHELPPTMEKRNE
ncbi:MAG: SBBP repeat-containing protein [Candidatus Thorarchaeota archaeon]